MKPFAKLFALFGEAIKQTRKTIGFTMKNKSHIVILCLSTAILLAGCGLLYGYKPLKQFDQKDYDQMITSVLDRNFKICH